MATPGIAVRVVVNEAGVIVVGAVSVAAAVLLAFASTLDVLVAVLVTAVNPCVPPPGSIATRGFVEVAAGTSGTACRAKTSAPMKRNKLAINAPMGSRWRLSIVVLSVGARTALHRPARAVRYGHLMIGALGTATEREVWHGAGLAGRPARSTCAARIVNAACGYRSAAAMLAWSQETQPCDEPRKSLNPWCNPWPEAAAQHGYITLGEQPEDDQH